MSVRSSYFCTIAKITTLIFYAFGVVIASEQRGNSESDGLYLFLTEEEQRKESDRGNVSAAEDSASQPVLPEPEPARAAAPNKKTDEEPEPVKESAYSRYNGVVLQGSEILSVWINKRRLSVSEVSPSSQIEQVGRNGVIRISTARGVRVIAPGDLIANQLLNELLSSEFSHHTTQAGEGFMQ